MLKFYFSNSLIWFSLGLVIAAINHFYSYFPKSEVFLPILILISVTRYFFLNSYGDFCPEKSKYRSLQQKQKAGVLFLFFSDLVFAPLMIMMGLSLFRFQTYSEKNVLISIALTIISILSFRIALMFFKVEGLRSLLNPKWLFGLMSVAIVFSVFRSINNNRPLNYVELLACIPILVWSAKEVWRSRESSKNERLRKSFQDHLDK